MVRRCGHRVGNQHVLQIRRDECLTVPPPRKKESRRGESTGCLPQKAVYRGHVWTLDFIHDTTVKGGSFRVLSVVDEYTREVLALYTLSEVSVVIGDWRRKYNINRPHRSLGMKTPAEFAAMQPCGGAPVQTAA